MDYVEDSSTNFWYLTKNQSWWRRAHVISVFCETASNKILHCSFKTHFKEWRATFLHSNSIEWTIFTVKRHEITNQTQMSVVDLDSIHFENGTDLINKVCSTSFNTVLLCHLPNVIGLQSRDINNVRMVVECLKVNTLNQQVRFFLWIRFFFRSNKNALIDSVNWTN